MIKFEILETSDSDSIGEYRFIYPTIEIGTKKKSTLRIYDNALTDQIHIKTVGENLALIIINSEHGFLCNSKKYLMSALIKKDDIIEYNGLKLKIHTIEIDDNFQIDLKKFRKELLTTIQKNKPELLKILEAIEEDLLNLGVI